MATNGEEPVGSMGTDTPLACLSDRPQSLFNYFKQLFAQVTNPAIDPIREELVMSLTSYIGTERNILEETPQHCHTLKLPHPILTNLRSGKAAPRELGRFSGDHAADAVSRPRAASRSWSARWTACAGARRWPFATATALLILSDRGVDEEYAPIPSLLALTAVHNHLVRERHAHAGRADHRIGRAARGDAFRAADRLWRERGQSVSGDRDAGGHGAAGPPGQRHVRDGAEELQEGHQQGPAEGLLEDGHLDAAELSRRADLRSHRPEPRR